MGISLTLTEIGNVCLLLFFGTIGYIPILMPNTGGAASGHGQVEQVHGLNHVILVVIWAGILFYLWKSRFRLRWDLLAVKIALFYSAVVVIGGIFSSDPIGALSGGFAITVSTFYAIYLVSKFPLERLSIMLGWVMLLLALLNAFFAVVLPAYGLDHFSHGGAWQGVFHQKNSLGLVMVLGVAIGLSLKPQNAFQRNWKLAIIFLSLAEVGLSASREAWLFCGMLLMVHFVLRLLGRFQPKARVAILLFTLLPCIPIGSAIAANWTELLTSLGRDATLTGRVPLWAAVIEECKKHPWIGLHGEGFWATGNAERIYAAVHWSPTSAHNGYIECLLELGVVGLIPLVVLFIIAFRGSFKMVTSPVGFESSKLWIYTTFVIAAFNLVQTTTGQPNSIAWILLVGGACMLDANSRVRAAAPVYAYPRSTEIKVGTLVRL
jgi:exopolysaccharide production protein ExoQ